MTTPRDLVITALDVASTHPVEQGELSLALAGAELIDLLGAGLATLDGDRIMPGQWGETADRLLDQAAASLVGEAPYESVDDWLWRRGRDLAPAYLAALEAQGLLTRRRRRWTPFRTGERALVESVDRRQAGERWAAREPVLAALAQTVGIGGNETVAAPGDEIGGAVETVLAAVGEAALELEAVRQRRAIEQAAFDNVWRGD
ncbi:hypothetical protein ACZ90_28490 [Streptomyces albus subsp. albus]|nr:hypothetical protein ACZ90_28490 [Streptomyces albus subsp. albus]